MPPARRCLGFVETPFLSVTALVAGAMAKVARVDLLGLEPSGSERILIRLGAARPDYSCTQIRYATSCESALLRTILACTRLLDTGASHG